VALLLSGAVAVGLLFVLPIALARWCAWGDTFPRTAIALWYATGLLGWLALATFFVALTVAPLGGSLLEGVVKFTAGLVSGHPLAGLGLSEAVGLTLSFDLIVLLLGGWLLGVWQLRKRRQRHCELLDLLAVTDSERPDVTIVDHDEPMAYFIPGRNGRVVLSSGVMKHHESLAPVIVEHERGHRDAHHGLVLLPLASMNAFFAFVPFARLAPVAIRTYLEMSADDFARRRTSTQALREALEKLGSLAAAPVGAIAWDGTVVERRIERLGRARPSMLSLVAATGLIAAALVAVVLAWLTH